MVIISHDRHFLNSVCTHMADLDYGKITVYPGTTTNICSLPHKRENSNRLTMPRPKKSRRAESLRGTFFSQCFQGQTGYLSRTPDRQDQDRRYQPSSRQYPFIRFEYDEREKLHRVAVEVQKMGKGYDKMLFSNVNFRIDAGEKVAIIGPNGIGKTTLLRCLAGDLTPDTGTIKWADKANLGYYAQDHAHEFAEDKVMMDWMTDWRGPSDDDQVVRGTLGRLLFSGDDVKKKVKVLSGGEKGRMMFGKLMLQKPMCC